MPRGVKKPSNTQQSSGSDDAGFAEAVAKQVQSLSLKGTWEKKKKDSEIKFLSHAKSQLEKCGHDGINKFNTEVDNIQNVYEEFVAEYAATEDRIRALWSELLAVQTRAMELNKNVHNAVVESDKARERGQVRGMAIAKKAVEDSHALILSLQESSE